MKKIVLFLTCSIALIITSKAAGTGSFQPVGPSDFNQASAWTADYTSIAIDASGIPYVVYKDKLNGYKATVKKYNGSWVLVGAAGISTRGADYTSIAIDGSGNPYIAYIDSANFNKVTVKKYINGAWTTLGTAGFSGGAAKYTSIAIDGAGNVYVAYQDASFSNKAIVVKFNPLIGYWTGVGAAGISAGSADYTSIKIDGSGNLYLVYSDGANGGKVTVMKGTAGTWTTLGTTGFSASSAKYTSIAIDGSGTPYVVYAGQTGSYPFINNKATVKKYTAGAWATVGTASVVSADIAAYTSIAIDGSGTPYIVYGDDNTAPYGDGYKATVKKYMNGAWTTVGTATASVYTNTGRAKYTAIAIDASGTPYVVCQDAANGYKATVKKYTAGTWTIIGTIGFSAGFVGYSSMAIDASGTPYVVYSDGANGKKATVMKFINGAWTLVGTAGFSVGEASYTSIAIDPSGTPWIVYKDAGNYDKATVRKYVNGVWALTANFGGGISAGAVGYTSIAIDGNGNVYVAYQDGFYSSKATVMKFNPNVGYWITVGTPGFSTELAAFLSIKIDLSGTPYVAYTDGQTGVSAYKATVKKYTNGAWSTVGIEKFSPGPAFSISLAIDGSGTPYIVYHNPTTSTISVLYYKAGAWTLVGTEGFAYGGYPSMAIDRSGTPYISYSDFNNNGKATVMKYNSAWSTVGIANFSAGPAVEQSMAIDGNDIPYIVFTGGFTGTQGVAGGAFAYKFVPSSAKRDDEDASITSINEASSDNVIKLYPNPTLGNVTVQLQKESQVVVVDLLGNVLFNKILPANEQVISLENQPAGIYFMIVSSDSTQQKIKIVKE